MTGASSSRSLGSAVTDVMSDLRAEATKQFAIRHGVAVASASLEQMLATATAPPDVVRMSHQMNEFNQSFLKSEKAFLETIVNMNKEEKVLTLFELFDRDGGGTVSSQEMARAFSKMDGGKTFKESLSAAMVSIAAYDVNDDGEMDIEEFGFFLQNLMGSLQVSMEDFAQFLALKIAFGDSGTAVLDDGIISLIQQSTESASRGVLEDAVVEVRMLMLFQLLDMGGTGKVIFEDVVKSMHGLLDFMDATPRQALLLAADANPDLALDYPQFSSLFLNVLSSCMLNFHEIANEMTLAVCKNDFTREDLLALFAVNEIQNLADSSANLDPEVAEALEYSRMTKLFDLWDLDHSGYLDFSELVLGLRKFHETKNVEDTVKESVAAILAYDEDNDQQFDRKEFAAFMVQFAHGTEVPLKELIDFMLVEFVMKENKEEEASYIESVKGQVKSQFKMYTGEADKQGVCGMRGLWSQLTANGGGRQGSQGTLETHDTTKSDPAYTDHTKQSRSNRSVKTWSN